MKTNKNIRLISAVLLLLVIVAAMSGCSFNSSISIGNYVSDIDSDVQQIVILTRDFKEIREDIDTRSPDDAKEYVEILDKLADLYTEILKTEAPDRYDDIDKELKDNSSEALSIISELKSLITASQNTGDDTLYKRESQSAIEKYDEIYTDIVDLCAQARTRFRND